MTVAEVVAKLLSLPQDAECVVHHYENGYSPVSVVSLEKVAADQQAGSTYTGPIGIPEEWEMDDVSEWMALDKRKPRAAVVRLDYRP